MATRQPRGRAWRRWRDHVRFQRALKKAMLWLDEPRPATNSRLCPPDCRELWHQHTWEDVTTARQRRARRLRDDSPRRFLWYCRNAAERRRCRMRSHHDERIQMTTWEQANDLAVRQDAIDAPRRGGRT